MKEVGNQHFKEKNYKEALKNYAKVFVYINGLAHKSDDMYKYAKKEGVENEDAVLNDREKEEIDNLKYTTWLNMTQIDLYNNNYDKAEKRASDSLKIKPSAKGYFRRACARIELGKIDEAEDDIKKCLELEPSNKEAKEKLVIVKALLKQTDIILGSKLKKMF